MKVKELREKKIIELNTVLIDLLKEHFELRMQHKGSELKDTSKLTKIRRNIAKVKTIIKEKTNE